MIAIVSKYHRLGKGFSKREKLEAYEHPGRRTKANGYQSPASWLCDLADLKKFILLCSYCRTNFNPRKNHYRRAFVPCISGGRDPYGWSGKCDACNQETANVGGGTGYVHEEYYQDLFVDPVAARRRARAAWKAVPVSRAIRRKQ